MNFKNEFEYIDLRNEDKFEKWIWEMNLKHDIKRWFVNKSFKNEIILWNDFEKRISEMKFMYEFEKWIETWRRI